ncbi:MAG: arsinothricin resistance N-acetyltransferase ArsN1 family B [Myxococcota bacterium]
MSVVRLATPADGEALAAIYAPIVRETAISFEASPPSGEAMAARVEATLRTHPWLVAAREGAVVGYAYAGPHRRREAYRWAVETSVYVDARARRGGVARRLYEALLAQLALLGYREALAGVTLPNEASVAFHESFGFEPVGIYRRVGFKRGAWHDVGWWQRPLGEVLGAPSEPRAPAALAGSAAWEATLG